MRGGKGEVGKERLVKRMDHTIVWNHCSNYHYYNLQRTLPIPGTAWRVLGVEIGVERGERSGEREGSR